MLKRLVFNFGHGDIVQPPLGGCVLKRVMPTCLQNRFLSAAFRRLCVETYHHLHVLQCILPAAFRRLCVETFVISLLENRHVSAAFRRLCVETMGSRMGLGVHCQPPLGGCVLKRP